MVGPLRVAGVDLRGERGDLVKALVYKGEHTVGVEVPDARI
jgi:hypothetical protein